MPDLKKLREKGIIAYLLVFFCALIYISLGDNYNVWMDEAFTASLVKTDYRGVLIRSMNDTLPPLYNLLLKLSTDLFGYSVMVMKLTSAFFMVLTMLLGARVVRRRFGDIASYLFIIAVAVMPNMMFYGVEIRMYSLGFFFATASGIYAYEYVCEKDRKNFMLLLLFSVGAGYSHHFAFVTAGFVYLWLLLYFLIYERERIKSFFVLLLATFVLYFPCMIVTLKQLKSVSGYFSMPEVTLKVFIKYMRYPFTLGFTPLSVVMALYMFYLIVKLIMKKEKNREDFFALACFFIYYGVLLFGTLVSKIMTANIFVDRYLFFAMGLLWLFMAIRTKELKKGFVYLVLIMELIIGAISYRNAYARENEGDALELINYLNENVSEGDILYTVEDAEGLALSLPFYDDRLTNYEELSEVEEKRKGHKVWVAVLEGFELDEHIPNKEKLKYIDEFSFDRYRFKLYLME
ncbi:MAG: glycosyltransferase family 39 protein [Lachnospiraceae bacterium]|nr:glycosyltransferase family 39 protein [Lachnospiraceae bacterium]